MQSNLSTACLQASDFQRGVGVIGYEIPFYQYESPRELAEIDADLDVMSAEIMEMLWEVHS